MSWYGEYAAGLLHDQRAAELAAEARRDGLAREARAASGRRGRRARRAASGHWSWRPTPPDAAGCEPAARVA